MIFCANELGETEEARATLEACRFRYKAHPDPTTQGRLLLLDGRICRNEGRLEKSEDLLRRLASLYAEHDMAFDLTLATLEWAESLVLLGRFRPAAEVMHQLYPLIERWHLPMDILRAWKILHDAIRAQSVQTETFRELAMTIRRKWHRRNLAAGDRCRQG